MNGLNPVTSIHYMIAGYAVIFIIQAVYLTSIVLRFRKLKQEIKMLREIENK